MVKKQLSPAKTSVTRHSTKEVLTRSAQETMEFAKELWREIAASGARLLLLQGDLGAGKTIFVQGLAQEIGVTRAVQSPTFVLIREYPGIKINLVHVDLYRLDNKPDISGLHLEEYLSDPKNILVVEWAEKLPRAMFSGYPCVSIALKVGPSPNMRRISVKRR